MVSLAHTETNEKAILETKRRLAQSMMTRPPERWSSAVHRPETQAAPGNREKIAGNVSCLLPSLLVLVILVYLISPAISI